MDCGGFLCGFGAVERATRTIRLSPFDFLNYLSYNALAISYLYTGQYTEAHEAAQRSVQLNPRFSVCHLFLAAALVRLEAEIVPRAGLDRTSQTDAIDTEP